MNSSFGKRCQVECTSATVIPKAYTSLAKHRDAPFQSSGLCHRTVPAPLDCEAVMVGIHFAKPKSQIRARRSDEIRILLALTSP